MAAVGSQPLRRSGMRRRHMPPHWAAYPWEAPHPMSGTQRGADPRIDVLCVPHKYIYSVDGGSPVTENVYFPAQSVPFARYMRYGLVTDEFTDVIHP